MTNLKKLELRPKNTDMFIKGIAFIAFWVGIWVAYVFFTSLGFIFKNQAYTNSLNPRATTFLEYIILPIAGLTISILVYLLFASFFERIFVTGNDLIVKRLLGSRIIPFSDIKKVKIEKMGDFMGTNETRLPGYLLSRIFRIHNKIVINYGNSDKEMVLKDVGTENAKEIEKFLKQASGL